jgi:hypothetical protein
MKNHHVLLNVPGFIKRLSLVIALPTIWAFALFILLQQPVTANVLMVTNTNDSGIGSLRQAIADSMNGDTIEFDASLSGQTITLTTGELVIDKIVTLDASSLAERPSINGNHNSRLFQITAGSVVTLTHLQLVNGATITGQWTCPDYCGGAILVSEGSQLLVYDSQIISNTAYSVGAAIANYGSLRVVNSTLSENSTQAGGGGIYSSSGDVLISDSVISRNIAAGGGGIFNVYGTLLVQNSHISENIGGLGGGLLLNYGSLVSITQTSILSNVASGVYQNSGKGGGIYSGNNTVTIITQSEISANDAIHDGGGISNGGTMTITNSIISNNTADHHGGGVHTAWKLAVKQSTISNNHAEVNGGGLASYLTIYDTSIVESTINNNTANEYGGGIAAGSNLFLSNSTVSGNEAFTGGGIFHWLHVLTVTNSTIAGNFPTGIMADYSVFYLSNTIIADHQGYDCYLSSIPFQINVNNLIEDGSCLATLTGDPMLGPLSDNGGATYTHALLAGSPAIDTGSNSYCPAIDQRGVFRPLDGNLSGTYECDIGAYEYDAGGPTPTPTQNSTPSTTPTNTVTPSITPTPPPTPTPSRTPTASPTLSNTPTLTPTPSSTPTATPTTGLPIYIVNLPFVPNQEN